MTKEIKIKYNPSIIDIFRFNLYYVFRDPFPFFVVLLFLSPTLWQMIYNELLTVENRKDELSVLIPGLLISILLFLAISLIIVFVVVVAIRLVQHFLTKNLKKEITINTYGMTSKFGSKIVKKTWDEIIKARETRSAFIIIGKFSLTKRKHYFYVPKRSMSASDIKNVRLFLQKKLTN